MNKADADRLGIKDGDLAKLVSPTNPKGEWVLPNNENIPVAGKVKVIQGIRPGTVAVSWHWGHWGYGAKDFVVDHRKVKGDARRAAGLCPNAVMLDDPFLKNATLSDPIGGSASFLDTRVNVVKL